MGETVPRSDGIELDAYLERIGVRAAGPADHTLLTRLHRAHTTTLCHENVDVVLGREVGLTPADLNAKMVRGGRGGNCLEHNLLFASVLEHLGYRVTRLAGRVRMGDRRIRTNTHVTLLVDDGRHTWLADVGFGGPGPLEPLPFSDGAVSRQEGWTYELVEEAPRTWVLRLRREEGPFDLYSFTPDEQHHCDFVVANHYITTHPSSPFTGGLLTQFSQPGGRLLLRNGTLTRTWSDGSEESLAVGPDELPALLRGEFGLRLDEDEAAVLVRSWQSGGNAVRPLRGDGHVGHDPQPPGQPSKRARAHRQPRPGPPRAPHRPR